MVCCSFCFVSFALHSYFISFRIYKYACTRLKQNKHTIYSYTCMLTQRERTRYNFNLRHWKITWQPLRDNVICILSLILLLCLRFFSYFFEYISLLLLLSLLWLNFVQSIFFCRIQELKLYTHTEQRTLYFFFFSFLITRESAGAQSSFKMSILTHQFRMRIFFN